MILKLLPKITKKKKRKVRRFAGPNPPSWDVPLDQTTAPITYIDGLPYI